VVHAKAKGSIVVTVPDQAAERAVTKYLTSFLDDELLSLRYLKRDDGLTVGSVRILVLLKDTPRRPKQVLARVEMLNPAEVQKEPEPYPGDRETARRLLLMYRHAIHTPEDQLNAAELEFKASSIYAAIKQLPPSRDDERWQAWRRCQRGLHSGSSLEGLVSEDPGRTKIVTQKLEPGHPDYREDWQLPAIEQRRSQELKERAGQDDPRGGPALTGPRGPRWRR